MRILIAGNWQKPMYEQACASALSELGMEVHAFRWSQHFSGRIGQLQKKFPLPGPALHRLNAGLQAAVEEMSPDIVFVWRGTHVLPSTLRSVKKSKRPLLVSYNNDDPFGPVAHRRAPWHHNYLWHWYIKAIREYDVHFAYRQTNVEELRTAGAKSVHLLLPYFVRGLHRPLTLTPDDQKKYNCDVVFVGHYEPDGRERYVKALVDAGVHVKLFGGPYWSSRVLGSLQGYFGKVEFLAGDEYVKALCGARMCLAFLSKLNRDTYTRRCFEIPACGSLLLSERTEALARMFRENREAVFFSTPEELVSQARRLLANPGERWRIASAGMRRVGADGHSELERMRQVVSILNEHRCEQDAVWNRRN